MTSRGLYVQCVINYTYSELLTRQFYKVFITIHKKIFLILHDITISNYISSCS